MYVALLLIDLGSKTFSVSSTTPGRKRNTIIVHSIITLSMNNRITIGSYCVQLFATLFEQLGEGSVS